MAKIQLSCEVHNKGFYFRLMRHPLLGKPAPLPITEWTNDTKGEHLPGAVCLLAWVDEEEASIEDNAVIVPHAKMATLDSISASSLSSPPTPPYVLDLQHVGTLDREDFRFKVTWLQTNGQPVPGTHKIGAALTVGSKWFRLPEPLFSIIEASETFNATQPGDMDARFRAWARMRELLPEETGKSIQVDGYLSSTRVAHAASFSLSLYSGSDGFTFDPVLFGPDLTKSVAQGIEEIPHEVDNLLPPKQQELFAKKRFPESTKCRAHYALGEGWYVVLDEPVRQALEVVRHAQTATPDVRKEFVRNPRSFLTKALGNDLSDDQLESLFIETAEYSDRVSDVGIWQPKVLPWVQKSKEKWIPESFGIQIGGKIVELKDDQVSVLQESVQTAISENRPFVDLNGIQVPATQETLTALNSLIGVLKPTQQPITGESTKEDATESNGTGGKIVLEIEGNLSEVEYQRVRVRRPTALNLDRPTSLKSGLKPHQVEGLFWIQRAWASGQPGVLLADDMGLGKTIQALSFLAWLREGMAHGLSKKAPILIVAPTGLLKNWEQEHDLHLHNPGLGDVIRAFGPGLSNIRYRKGREIEIGLATIDSERLSRADWILTTYETLRDYQHSFCAIRYVAVVFDEIQKIKTPGTVMTHAAKALNADFFLGLTGTPIENRLADLWCIVDTIQPGFLKDLSSFSREYEKEENPESLRRLKKTLTAPSPPVEQIMMRRMKVDRIEGLPEKIEHPMEQHMSPAQAEAYDDAVKLARSEGAGCKMLEVLHRLRSISLHPLHPSMAQDDSYIGASARLKLTLAVLDDVAKKNEKALVFLESIEMQPYLASLLQRRYNMKSLPMLINGRVSGPKRQQRVNDFQSGGAGFDVFILSPRAGGVGLTLTAANHVIHLSRWWNPAVEDQCTDRVYRIGQTREVHVYYPLAIHPAYPDQSFDRRLHSLLDKKRQLSREMLMPPSSPEDTKELFEQTIGTDYADTFCVEDIDSMEPIQFEEWVLARLVDKGHKVSRTPKTRDGGADGVVYHRITSRAYIIQCKHTQRSTSPDDAVADLLRAKDFYRLDNPGLLAVTNAKSFSQGAQNEARLSAIKLICREDLKMWPIFLD